jgi:hypothetical protein
MGEVAFKQSKLVKITVGLKNQQSINNESGMGLKENKSKEVINIQQTKTDSKFNLNFIDYILPFNFSGKSRGKLFDSMELFVKKHMSIDSMIERIDVNLLVEATRVDNINIKKRTIMLEQISKL